MAIKKLIDHGVDISTVADPRSGGDTPLSLARLSPEIIELLLEHGADVDRSSHAFSQDELVGLKRFREGLLK